MKVRLMVDMDLPAQTDWFNTRLLEFQQLVAEANALETFLGLDPEQGEHLVHVTAEIVMPKGTIRVLGGTYEPPAQE